MFQAKRVQATVVYIVMMVLPGRPRASPFQLASSKPQQ